MAKIKKQSTAKGFTVLGAASILNKALSIVYVPFLTIMIGDVGNGIANVGYIIYLLIYQITYMGVPVALSKMVSEQIATGRYHDSLRMLKIANTMLLLMGLVLGGAMAAGAKWIAQTVGTPESAMTLLALSPTVLIASFSASFRGYFQGRHNMTPTSVSQVVEQAANTVFTLVFAYLMLKIGREHAVMHGITNPDMIRLYSLQWGAAGSGLGTTAGAVFSAVYLLVMFVRKRGEIREEAAEEDKSNLARGRSKLKAQALTGQLMGQLLRYAAPVTLGALIVYSAGLVDMTFTKNRLMAAGFSDTDATGLYGILTTQYQKIIGVPLALANTLAVVMLPNISGSAALKDREALHAKIDGGLRAAFLLTVPSAVILAVMAEPIIRLLFPHNVSGMDLMRLGSWVIVLMALVQLQTSVLQGMGRMQLPVIHMSAALVLKIAVNYALIGIRSVNVAGVEIGINVRGAVAGSALCYGLAAVLNYMQIRKNAEYRARWHSFLFPPLAASAAMGLAAWGVWLGLQAALRRPLPFIFWRNFAATVPALLVGAAVYGVAIVLFRGVSRKEVLGVPLLPRLIGKERTEKILDLLKVN
jgi:stage V sporulation protein B